LDRVGVKEIEEHNESQAMERERTMLLLTATLWGWKDPSLTKYQSKNREIQLFALPRGI
jgi:hypothetical protein